MKYLLCLLLMGLLLGCSGDSSNEIDTEDTQDTQANGFPIIQYQRALYPETAPRVSFADVLSLTFEVPTERLSYGGDSLQIIDYWPAQSISGRENLPAIVLLHGGCWSRNFRIDQSYPMATALSLNGFNVWSIEYRASGDAGGGWPGTFNDVQLALELILSNQSAFYSARSLVVLGHSAGGHLGLLAVSKRKDDIQMIGLAAIVNIIDYANGNSSCSSLALSFMNGRPTDIPELYSDANPDISELRDSSFLFIGGQDSIVPQSQAINSTLAYLQDDDAGHFDWIHPGTNSFSELLKYLLDL